MKEAFDPAGADQSARRTAQLETLEPKHFWFRARNRLIAWAVRRHFPKARRLLEIGSGTGFVLSMLEREFPALELCGSEFHAESLAPAQRRLSRAQFVQLDAEKIPFKGEFDVVGAFDVIEHIADDERVLSEMANALKPGGGVILTVPQHMFLWSGIDEHSGHHRRYGAGELRRKLEKAGFTIALSTSFVTFLLPLFLLSRLRYRGTVSQEKAAASSEFSVGPAANAVLEKILDLELWLISRGVRFPCGSTLLMVGVRR